MSEVMQDNSHRGEIWKRGLYMLLFSILYGVAEVVMSIVVVLQFLVVLLTGSANQQLLRLGGSLANYSREVFLYLTFNSETQPFPMNDWPGDRAEASPWYEAPATYAAPAASGSRHEASQVPDRQEGLDTEK